MSELHLIKIVRETCCVCGIVFGMEEEYRKRKSEEGDGFYCPNGHKQWYVEPKIPMLKKEIERLRQDKAYCGRKLENERRSHRATKGHLTRKKKELDKKD